MKGSDKSEHQFYPCEEFSIHHSLSIVLGNLDCQFEGTQCHLEDKSLSGVLLIPPPGDLTILQIANGQQAEGRNQNEGEEVQESSRSLSIKSDPEPYL